VLKTFFHRGAGRFSEHNFSERWGVSGQRVAYLLLGITLGCQYKLSNYFAYFNDGDLLFLSSHAHNKILGIIIASRLA
jgi:hypothetical protein